MFVVHMAVISTRLRICMDSLIRVSRRDNWNRIFDTHGDPLTSHHTWVLIGDCVQLSFPDAVAAMRDPYQMTRRRKQKWSSGSLSHAVYQVVSSSTPRRYFLLSFARASNDCDSGTPYSSWTSQIPVTRPSNMHVSDGCAAIISNAFNFLLKVLCNFPTRYLFAIELEIPFNLR